MTRKVLTAVFLVFATGTVVLALNGLARDREFARLIAEGDAALAAGETDVAVEAFSGAIAIKSDSMLAHLKRGDTYRRRGELSAALRDLRIANQLDPTATRPLELLGDLNAALDRYPRAIQRYEEYIALDDRSPRVFYKLGLARYRAGDVSGAMAAARRAVALNDHLAEAYYLLGLCLRADRQHRAAQEALERAVALAPALVAAREELASLHTAQRQDREAIDQLEALAALEPARPERLIAVGLAYARAGQQDTAILTLRRVAERFPAHEGVFVALGRVWLDAAESRRDRVALGKALKALEPVAQSASATSEALTLYGRALLLAGDLAAAERAFERAAQTLPLEPMALLDLATTAERLGRLSVCRDALVRYSALAGEDPGTEHRALRIGDLSMRLGEPATAAAWYRKAVQTSDGAVVPLIRLAEAEARLGRHEEARAAVTRGLAKDPTNRELLALRRRLGSR